MHQTILLVALIAASSVGVKAGDAALDRATLRGLKAFNIVIDPLDLQLEKAGLSADAIRARIDTRLRHAGIPLDNNAIEFVGLRIDSTFMRKGPTNLCFSLAFYQPVALARDSKIRTATQTWDVHSMLLVPPKTQLQAAAQDAVDQLADQFVTAYRSVNPQ